jgi:primosomal protein N' (replication factor Y)
MFLLVSLLNGFQKQLTYKAPDTWSGNLVGRLVRVPLRNRAELAFIEQTFDHIPKESFTIREALSLHDYDDEVYRNYIAHLSDYYAVSPKEIYYRIKSAFSLKETELALPELPNATSNTVQLNDEQQAAVDAIIPDLANKEFKATLIHGVTGSGKTEVYKKIIAETVTRGKTSLLLVPEVSLAVHLTHRLKQDVNFATRCPILSYHSATSAQEKKTTWQHIQMATPMLIIGVHLPVLLPIKKLGLIIIDEEHDGNFQEKKHPKIHTREAALLRAYHYKIPIVLGSATPSIESLYCVKNKGWRSIQLLKRYSGTIPQIQFVTLPEDKKRPSFWISTHLQKAITERLAQQEQVIIYINRRGYSFFIQCGDCSVIITCPACSVSLTLHEDTQLKCHYCTFEQKSPNQCPSCKAPEKSLLKKGIGTQQMVGILQKIFPAARIARADLDTTVNRKKWQKTMQDMLDGHIDILVGTQTITKGYHFPKVTLVGVIWADIQLSIPSYKAVEQTLQQLIQVAGRAGRESENGLVIIQSMMDYPFYQYINEATYPQLYDYEAEHRSIVLYPPWIRFAELEIRHMDEVVLIQETQQIVEEIALLSNTSVRVLGPTLPPVHKINHMHLRKIYLKSSSLKAIRGIYDAICAKAWRSSIYFNPHAI